MFTVQTENPAHVSPSVLGDMPRTSLWHPGCISAPMKQPLPWAGRPLPEAAYQTARNAYFFA